jgi:hypothetical protein
MSRKYNLIGSLLLPLMAAPNLAYAGPQGSDRAWWPNQAQSYGSSQGYTTKPVAARDKVAPQAIGGQQACRYQGGPRSPLVCSAR